MVKCGMKTGLIDRMHAACCSAGLAAQALHASADTHGATRSDDLRAQLAALLLQVGEGTLSPLLADLITQRRERQTRALIATFSGSKLRAEPDPELSRPVQTWTVEEGRLLRAHALTLWPSPGGFEVSGGAEPHQVTHDLTCDCRDQERTRLCKHVLAVLIHQGRLLRSGSQIELT